MLFAFRNSFAQQADLTHFFELFLCAASSH